MKGNGGTVSACMRGCVVTCGDWPFRYPLYHRHPNRRRCCSLWTAGHLHCQEQYLVRIDRLR